MSGPLLKDGKMWTGEAPACVTLLLSPSFFEVHLTRDLVREQQDSDYPRQAAPPPPLQKTAGLPESAQMPKWTGGQFLVEYKYVHTLGP